MEMKKEYASFMGEVFRALPETFFIKDRNGRYAFTTKVCDLVNAGPNGTIIGKTDPEIQIDKQLGMRYYEEDMDIIKNGISTHTIDAIDTGEKIVYMEITKNPIYNDKKQIIGICGICNDITELVNLRQKYEQLSLYDSLTGLYNRNYTAKFDFDNEYSLPCSYILCDCNNLKMINDKYGHKAGDKYICEAADMLKRTVSENSVVIRWGGDEFLVVTPSCTKDMHETMMKAIKASRDKIYNTEPDTGLAVGGELRTDLCITEAEIIREADAHMYLDKASIKRKYRKIS